MYPIIGWYEKKLKEITDEYLDGQNCTSSTVSSCPWYTPLGPTVGLPELFTLPALVGCLPLEFGVDETGDFDNDSDRDEI